MFNMILRFFAFEDILNMFESSMIASDSFTSITSAGLRCTRPRDLCEMLWSCTWHVAGCGMWQHVACGMWYSEAPGEKATSPAPGRKHPHEGQPTAVTVTYSYIQVHTVTLFSFVSFFMIA